jgi:protein phosphatase
MSLILHAATVTDVGLVRANNEDSAYAGRRVFAVADGVGGMPAGEVASALVIRALTELDGEFGPADPVVALREAVESANRHIRERVEADPMSDGMGTTVTALLVADDRIALLHVGDSRCYLLREPATASSGADHEAQSASSRADHEAQSASSRADHEAQFTQLTRDDTFVQMLVDQGLLRPDEARTHPRRSLVTQAVQGDDLTPAVSVLSPRPGDRFLLCSDGLSDAIADAAIAAGLRSDPDPQRCAEALVRLALSAGASDNVTVIVADVAEGPDR